MNYLKKTAVATAIAGALGAGASVAGDGVWFPYVSKGPTFTTVITTVNTSRVLFDEPRSTFGVGSAHKYMHWILNFKSGADFAVNKAGCDHFDRSLPTSKNDVTTVDLGGVFGNGNGVMFNDTIGDGVDARLLAGLEQPVRGHLLVANADTSSCAGCNSGYATVSGEMLNIDYMLGAAVGDQGVAMESIGTAGSYGGHSDNWGGTANPFSGLGLLNIVLANSIYDADFTGPGLPPFDLFDLVQRLPFMPFDEVATNLLVTPIASMEYTLAPDGTVNGARFDYGSMFTAGNNNNWGLTVSLGTEQGGGGGVAFNRNENHVSGFEEDTVVCVGKVNVEDLLSEGQEDFFADGGWSYLRPKMVPAGLKTMGTKNAGKTVRQSRGAHVFKHELDISGMLSGGAIQGGRWNNMLQLHAIEGYFEIVFDALEAEGLLPAE